MKQLNLKLIFPYNWYHFRKVKVYGDNGKLLSKIMHCENLSLLIDGNTKSITVKLDFLISEIFLPQDSEEWNIGLFLDFRDRFPIKYFDILKRKCLTGKTMSNGEFENFNLSFYNQSKIWVQKANIDTLALSLGIFISIGLLIVALIEQTNDYQDLVFFIGLISLISMLMIHFEKEKILLYDYRNRMLATGLAFILGIQFLESSFAVVLTLLFLSFVFLLKFVKNFYTIKT
ncbi:hypothetical protein [Flavobacterium soli]|uniref:hypothetical protein n=1 Tax=Flavobacterium soli TaxID=344881 RepID=UPI0003F4C23B|nr:hypothetical protein [Flavobacterium soli]